MTNRLLQFFLALTAFAHPAWAIEFSLPLDCHYGENCFIQNYVDDGASHADYHCRHLSYDGHKGTDFRLRNFADMQKGVKVIAAADGTVLRLRNDVPDTGRQGGNIAGRECGNGVVISHADGFQTQYCHLKMGSINVHPGDSVRTGDVIGEVGYSGETEFPHVHFQVTHNGEVVDPFNAGKPAQQSVCDSSHESLWRADVKLPYIDTAIIASGFGNAVPQKDNINAPLVATDVKRDSPAIVFWVTLIGLEQGDVLTFSIKAPDGSIMAEQSKTIDHFKAVMFSYVGKKLHAPLAVGDYNGNVKLVRGGKEVVISAAPASLEVR